MKVDSEHISTAHIEWPEGRQSSESCGCRRSHLIILDVVVVERKEDDGDSLGRNPSITASEDRLAPQFSTFNL